VSRWSSGLAWYEQTGPLTYIRHALDTVVPRDSSVIDLDGDGDADILVHATNAIYWYKNQGDATFVRQTIGTAALSPNVLTAEYWDFFVTFDAEGDGDQDIATIFSGGIRLYKNIGSGSFTAVDLGATESSATPNGVAAGDLNGDGTLEIVVNGATSFQVIPFGDFDRNGRVEQADRDLWEQTNGQSVATPGAGADGDRSGTIDELDLAVWEAHQGEALMPRVRAANASSGTTADEKIDGFDFLAWQRTLGTVTTAGGSNDWDYSGKVDAGDLAVWRQQAMQGLVPNTAWINSGLAEATSEPAVAAAVVAEEDVAKERTAEGAAVAVMPANVILSLETMQPAAVRRGYRPARPEASLAPRAAVAARDAALAATPATRSLRAGAGDEERPRAEGVGGIVDCLFEGLL
jgi:hypothetical protein